VSLGKEICHRKRKGLINKSAQLYHSINLYQINYSHLLLRATYYIKKLTMFNLALVFEPL